MELSHSRYPELTDNKAFSNVIRVCEMLSLFVHNVLFEIMYLNDTRQVERAIKRI